VPLCRFFAANYDRSMRRVEDAGLRERRARLLGTLEGDVLEVGAGTGLNLEHYPPGARLVLAEPDPHMRHFLLERLTETDRAARVVEATAEDLPFADESFDAVVSTLVLCSVRSVRDALAEIRRVLRPRGTLLLIEHVRGGGGRAVVQEVVAPVSRLLFSCSPDRRTADAIRAAGFELDDHAFELAGGAPWTKPAIEGVAIRAS
jgi:ubiquinone/menaquinone biosynthesis C-methylase UbiE